MKKEEKTLFSPVVPPDNLVATPLFQEGAKFRPPFDVLTVDVNTQESLKLAQDRDRSRGAVETIQRNLLVEIVTPLALRKLRASMKAGDSSGDSSKDLRH